MTLRQIFLPSSRRAVVYLFAIGIALTTLPLKASADDWADLEVAFVYDAPDGPERQRIAPLDDASCIPANLMPLSEELIVDARTMGIQNVVLYLDPKISGLQASDCHPALRNPPVEPAVLTMRDCVFEPHVFVSRVGQKMRLINSDIYGHNPSFVFFANGLESRMHPPGHSVDLVLSKSERAPSPVRCNIHPWMQAYVLVFDHPYAAISDQRGLLRIENLPAGKPITFKLWHESMKKSIDEVSRDGRAVIWPRGNVQLVLQPGKNDLGAVKIKPEVFKK